MGGRANPIQLREQEIIVAALQKCPSMLAQQYYSREEENQAEMEWNIMVAKLNERVSVARIKSKWKLAVNNYIDRTTKKWGEIDQLAQQTGKAFEDNGLSLNEPESKLLSLLGLIPPDGENNNGEEGESIPHILTKNNRQLRGSYNANASSSCQMDSSRVNASSRALLSCQMNSSRANASSPRASSSCQVNSSRANASPRGFSSCQMNRSSLNESPRDENNSSTGSFVEPTSNSPRPENDINVYQMHRESLKASASVVDALKKLKDEFSSIQECMQQSRVEHGSLLDKILEAVRSDKENQTAILLQMKEMHERMIAQFMKIFNSMTGGK